MKKYILVIVGFVLLICSIVGFKETFGAETALFYDGTTKDFTFSNLDNADLFDSFKDLVPGDVRSQSIRIRARNINTDTKLYLKLNRDSNSQLLDYINVSYYANDVLLLEHDDVVLIQSFDNDSDIELKIVVEVPIEVGNEVAGLSHSLSWAFLVEENEEPPVEVPATGENIAIKDVIYENGLFILLFIVGMSILTYGVIGIIKKRD